MFAFLVQENYEEVMSEYKLGPNGGILTACNHCATLFDQVMAPVGRPRSPPWRPLSSASQARSTILHGITMVFTWYASEKIFTEILASSFPTVVLFVMDTPRSLSPQLFMSKMMQACSILHKTHLAMILCAS
jgi:GPN-loop GTPase